MAVQHLKGAAVHLLECVPAVALHARGTKLEFDLQPHNTETLKGGAQRVFSGVPADTVDGPRMRCGVPFGSPF